MQPPMLISIAACCAGAALWAQDFPNKKIDRFSPEIGPPAITVTGINGTTVNLTGVDLSGLPQQRVKASDHGTAVTFEGVLLSDVLAKVDTPTGEKYRGTAASYYVVVQAKDGYRAVFAWAELDSTFTDRKIFLATRRDGKPLAEKDGPFLTIVPDEKRQSRWVRQAVSVSIKQAGVEP